MLLTLSFTSIVTSYFWDEELTQLNKSRGCESHWWSSMFSALEVLQKAAWSHSHISDDSELLTALPGTVPPSSLLPWFYFYKCSSDPKVKQNSGIEKKICVSEVCFFLFFSPISHLTALMSLYIKLNIKYFLVPLPPAAIAATCCLHSAASALII